MLYNNVVFAGLVGREVVALWLGRWDDRPTDKVNQGIEQRDVEGDDDEW